MSFGKRLTGLLLIGLGAIGMAACLAGIAGLWIGASRLQQVNSRLFHQVDQLIVQVDQRATQAQNAAGGTRDLVEALKRTLKESAAELLAGRVASLPEIENIERRLASAMERTDQLVELSVSTAELIEQLLATIDIIASERNVDLQNSSDLMATIRSTRQSLANASERLADVERRWLRSGRNEASTSISRKSRSSRSAWLPSSMSCNRRSPHSVAVSTKPRTDQPNYSTG